MNQPHHTPTPFLPFNTPQRTPLNGVNLNQASRKTCGHTHTIKNLKILKIVEAQIYPKIEVFKQWVLSPKCFQELQKSMA